MAEKGRRIRNVANIPIVIVFRLFMTLTLRNKVADSRFINNNLIFHIGPRLQHNAVRQYFFFLRDPFLCG